jgi:phosphatidylglycerol:prolipoprotein diacylglycerol transferase
MSARQCYGLFMLLAAGVFLLVRYLQPRLAPVAALPWWKRTALIVAGFIGGSLGAKLPFALANESGWLTRTAWLADGKTITTGLLGAYLAVELAKLALGIRVKTGDTFALPLALALAVGRWGCFFGGCCYGTPTTLPWGVDFGDAVRRHPTQIYESLFHLLMAGLLVLIIRCDVLRYQRLKLYLIAYGGYRFLTEFIRPEPTGWLGMTFYQWVAMILIVFLSIQWQIDRRLPQREMVLAPG